MKTLEQLQDPSSLRLAMGELDANELLVAQAAVRFAFFHLTDGVIPPRKTVDRDGEGRYASEQYATGWNDCREAMIATTKC